MISQLEICCTSFDSAKIAQDAGSNRIEICDNLYEGGTTPAPGLVEKIIKELDIRVHILIRPRGGDFCYSEDEFDIMKRDIEFYKDLGVDGFVSGVLDKDYNIDIERTRELVTISQPGSFTFHRAFDLVNNQADALEQLIDIEVDKVLTSGGKNNVFDGREQLTKLVQQASDKIVILAGGGLNSNNINAILATGCKEVHTTAKEVLQSLTNDINKVRMNGLKEIPENSRIITSHNEVKAIKKAIEEY